MWLPRYARQVREVLAELFSAGVVLVPVPGSSVSSRRVWAAEKLAVALRGIGLGVGVARLLRRRTTVRKSATAAGNERPNTQQHYESLEAVRSAAHVERLVLVDDVITKGRTAFAAALRLHEAFPHADIRVFALVRTLGLHLEPGRVLDPCQGFVCWRGGDTRREP